MGIKRYICAKDNSISNAFLPNLRTRATGASLGASDILEVFSIYAQANASSSEASRILLEFPVAELQYDRTNMLFPVSGSVHFYLNLYNAEHGETLPRQFNLIVNPLSRSFEEGYGLDHEDYTDVVKQGIGSNWVQSAQGVPWTTLGGDIVTTSSFNQYFDKGTENLQLNITDLVESWIAGTTPNYGVMVALTSSQESSSSGRSYYNKKFFGRTSEHFFKRPNIEARWDSSKKDNRGNFLLSSSALSAADNLHTIYFYNYYKGQLKNLANVGTGQIFVQLYTSASAGNLIVTSPTVITGGYVETGIYSASFYLTSTYETVFDRWFSGSVGYYTGSFSPVSFESQNNRQESGRYVNSLRNLKSEYSNAETVRLRLFSRSKNWSPNIYSVASNDVENNLIEDAYFKVYRLSDNYDIIPYGTGSDNHTRLSYDVSGNYFDIDTSMLEAGYAYGIKLIYLIDGKYEEQRERFHFRIADTYI